MSHRHLIAAYVITWVIQLSYGGVLLSNWLALRRAEKKYPVYSDESE